MHQDGKGFAPVEGEVLGRTILCELQQDTKQLEANIEALQRAKCTFFSKCLRQVCLLVAACTAKQTRPCWLLTNIKL